MNGERIKLARKRAGLSLRALADETGGLVSAQAIGKYERDEMTPSSGILLALVKALNVSVAFLLAPQTIKLGEVEFRTKASTSVRDRAKVEAAVLDGVERYLQVEQILELDSAEWHRPEGLPKRNSNAQRAEEVAKLLRKDWGLGNDPIPNMTELLEEKGIKVLLEFLPDRVSGFTCMVKRMGQGDVPVVIVNSRDTLERRRFTLAHELGHRVIEVKRKENPEIEKWCNHFAGAFLIPHDHLEREVGKDRHAPCYQELINLKLVYRVSACALLVRLKQVGVISKSSLEYAFRTFARGWRTREPEPISAEKNGLLERPRRFERLVYRALVEDLISPAKAAELLREPISKIEVGLRGPLNAPTRK